jgi:hypothetical protein
MRLLRLLSRVAFICNVCFLLASLVQYLPHPPEGEIISSIIVLGYFLSVIVNVLVNLSLLILFIFGKLKAAGIPVWLLIVNFLFFVVQFIVIVLPILTPYLK